MICPRCGQPVLPQATFCNHCGQRQTHPASSPSEPVREEVIAAGRRELAAERERRRAEQARALLATGQPVDRFAAALRQLRDLKRRLNRGELGEVAFRYLLGQLMVQDGDGFTWMLKADSEQWYRYDGYSWTPAEPPRVAVPAAAPVACPRCGFPGQPGERYCANCGRAVAAP